MNKITVSDKKSDRRYERTAVTYVGLFRKYRKYRGGSRVIEVKGKNYDRAQIIGRRDMNNAKNGKITNKKRISFPEVMGPWGEVNYFRIYDEEGHCVAEGPIPKEKLNDGDTAYFKPDDLIITI